VLIVAAACIVKSRYVVRNIEVSGNTVNSAERIAELAGLKLGDDMLRVDERALSRGIERDPYLQVVGFEKRYPGTVAIEVRESVPRAVVDSLGVYLLIDGQCRLLRFLSENEPRDVIVVTGVEIARQTEGARIESKIAGQTADLELLLEAAYERNLTSLFVELNVGNLDNLYLMTPAGIQVILGDSEQLTRKLIIFESIYTQLVAEGVRGGILDVSSGRSGSYRPR